MKNYIFKCASCGSETCHATLPIYVSDYAKKGCDKCDSKDILEHRVALSHEIPGNGEPEIPSISGARSLQVDDGFKDVLKKIKEAHPLALFDV